jgi:hypothetical protein
MKPGSLLVLFASIATLHAAGPSVIPERLSADRYAKLKSAPPFAVATETKPVETPEVPWSQGLHLSSAMQLNESGTVTDMVIVNDSNNPGTLITLVGDKVDKSGLQLVKLEWNPDPTKTQAVVKKGSETATLKRDQAAFVAPPAIQPGRGVQNPGGGRGVPSPQNQFGRGIQPPSTNLPNAGGVIRPPTNGGNIPRAPIPLPTGAIPAPQMTSPQQPVQANDPSQNGQEPRRRVRIINNR